MTKEDFFEILEGHDWYYQMSDDGRVYASGRDVENGIYGVVKEQPEFEVIFKAFYDYHFSGPAWGTEIKPKPVMEAFQNV